jgi:hypothetical protein
MSADGHSPMSNCEDPKNIIFLIKNRSHYGFLNVLSPLMRECGYTIHPLSLVKFADQYYYDGKPSTRIKRIETASYGTGAKGMLKRVLGYPPTKKFFYHLATILEYPFYLLWYIFQQYILFRDAHREMRLMEGKTNARAYIVPMVTIFSWESMYYPKTRLPIIAIPSTTFVGLFNYLGGSGIAQLNANNCLEKALLKCIAPQWLFYKNHKYFYAGNFPFLLSALLFGGNRSVKDLRYSFAGACIPSQRDREIYEEYGEVPPHWRMTGSITSDVLYQVKQSSEERRPEFYRKYGLLYNKTIVYDVDTSLILKSRHMDQLIRIANLAKNLGWNVVCCPHPNTPQEHIAILPGLGFCVAQEATIEILPLIDLYITQESSTLDWAKKLGIPSLSVGFQGSLNQSDWSGSLYFDGEELNSFYIKFENLLRNEFEYNELRAAAKKTAADQDFFDGHCGDRIKEYFLCVMGKNAE